MWRELGRGRAFAHEQLYGGGGDRQGAAAESEPCGAAGARGRVVFDQLVAAVRRRAPGQVAVETGEFGAMMEVELVNDGPVTFIVESGTGHGPRVTRRPNGPRTRALVLRPGRRLGLAP